VSIKKADAAPNATVKKAEATPPATVKKADATTGAAAKHAAAAGSFAVQIGAFSSQNLADKGWSSAAGLAPSATAGKGKRVAQITKSDGTTLYRAAITGFDSREEAQAVCAKLVAAGRACFVR
jgi:cell division protein FtsN